MPSLNNVSLDFKVFDCPSKEEKINQFKMLMKDPEVQPFFRNYIENIIATSELRILKRHAAVETALGLNDFSDFEDEDQELTIPAQLSLLAERIDNITEPMTYQETVKHDSVICPQTITEHRACELIDHLKNDIAPRNGEVFLTSREIMIFLKDGINVEYRIKKNVKNIRQVKKDVIEKAFEMFPTSVSLSKKSNGHKEVRVVLRQSSSVNLHTL